MITIILNTNKTLINQNNRYIYHIKIINRNRIAIMYKNKQDINGVIQNIVMQNIMAEYC